MTTELLNADSLLKDARDRVDWQDFGPQDYREGFEALIKSLNSDVDVSPGRAEPLRENILRLLTNRLHFERDRRRFPEIEAEEIHSPVIITSLPRTGSTKLHRMLGASGAFQILQYWKVHMFARLQDDARSDHEERVRITREYERWLYEVSPDMITGHPVFTHEPEEEMQLFHHAFRTTSFAIFGSRSHMRWLLDADPAPAYDYLLDQLKYLQWQFPAPAGQPWLLKAPAHFGHERHLSRVFEKPRFIVTHRHPADILPSVTNIARNWAVVYTTPRQQSVAIEMVVERYKKAVHEHLRWRETIAADRIMDVSFHDINFATDDLTTRIFDWLNLEKSERNVRNMALWEADNPKNKHGKNTYALAQLGIDRAFVETEFKEYLDRFDAYI